MERKEYDDFGFWLINVKKQKSTCPEIEYIYLINQLLFKRICEKNLFDIIRENRFDLLVRMRSHWSYNKNKNTLQDREEAIRLAFEFLGKDFERFLEYEYDSIPKSIRNKLWNEHTLYIHSGRIKCLRFHHDIKDVAAIIPVGDKENIKIHASYCTKCKLTFITKKYYLQLKKRFPIMVTNFCELDNNGNPLNKIEGNTESILKLCGYSAKRNGPSTEMRRFILRTILQQGILSKTDIITYLEFFLSFNALKDGMYNAEFKWSSDLEFVRNIDLDKHTEIKISEIKTYNLFK